MILVQNIMISINFRYDGHFLVVPKVCGAVSKKVGKSENMGRRVDKAGNYSGSAYRQLEVVQ